jgi:glycosyltransferase involved in cell wall biosynthesis
LEPLGELPADPHPDDPNLYLNAAPHVHACIGSVFHKPSQAVTTTSSKRIVLALLTWNTRDISIESVRAYANEARMLKRNGSNDGTPAALRTLQPELNDLTTQFIFNDNNLGNCLSRNQIIDFALAQQADYILFMDGDIEIVPFSSFSMLRYMESQGHDLGCLGADHAYQTLDRARVTPCLYGIPDHAVRPITLIAATQYGMFRCDMFRDGVRLEINDPFDQPGWGFEDNDLAFQIAVRGYRNCFFTGMIYLHRALHSSIPILRQNGYDAAALCNRRQHYVISKWKTVPVISNGPLREIQRLRLRV